MDLTPFAKMFGLIAADVEAQAARRSDPTIRTHRLQRKGGMFGAVQTITFYSRGGYLFHDAQCTTNICTAHGYPLTDDINHALDQHSYAFDWKKGGGG
ncbi:MAG: hypothetical protein ABW217_03910 [Polyangiaceae bacterium]